MSEPGVLDITQIVEDMKVVWIDYMIAWINGLEAVAPGFEWLNLPFINTIEEDVLRTYLGRIADAPIMWAFFENTAIRKDSQARDFTAAVQATMHLPEGISDEEYQKLEDNKMAAFRAFVSATN